MNASALGFLPFLPPASGLTAFLAGRCSQHAKGLCKFDDRAEGIGQAKPADMLEKIAAANDLTIADVVRLFLIEALPEPHWKLGNWELWIFRPPARVDLPVKTGRCHSNCHHC